MSRHTDTVREVAITVTTDQVKGWGVVGIVIIVVAAMILMRLVQTVVSRLVMTLVTLGVLWLCWQQHASIERSIKACDPHVLFLHVQISDPVARSKCMKTMGGISGALHK